MYAPIGIQKLSENQLRKLLKGEPVRVKHGTHHKIHLSTHQLKKLHSAHKKGKASTITFDPYQQSKHGEGIFGDIAKHIRNIAHKHKNLINPVIRAVKGSAHQGIHKLSKYAHSKIDNVPELEGEGILGDILGMVNPTIGGVAKTLGLGLGHSKHNKVVPYKDRFPTGEEIRHRLHVWDGEIAQEQERLRLQRLSKPHKPEKHFNETVPFTQEGQQVLYNKLVNATRPKTGNGVHHRKTRTKKGEGILGDILGMVNPTMGGIAKTIGLGCKKTKGKGFLTDIAKLAGKKAVEAGSNYLTNKIDGMGAKKKAGRPRKHNKKTHGGSGCGGALMPAGY
jgi:hypothetical protein